MRLSIFQRLNPNPGLVFPSDTAEPIRSELFSAERLEQHGETLAAAQRVTALRSADRRLAKRLVDNSRILLKAYRGVQKWLDTAARQGVTKGYTTTLLGRKRYYDVPASTDPDYRSKIASIERQAKNSPIQGGNADMTKIALVYLREALQGLDARVVNTVHDEIVVEAAEAIAEEVKHIVEFQMIRAGQEILRHVPVVADAAIGDYWKK